MFRYLIFPIFFSLVTPASPADNTIYKWTDENEVKHYTNQRKNIDESDENKVDEIRFRDKKRSDKTNKERESPKRSEQEIQGKETTPPAEKQGRIKDLWRSRMVNIERRIEQTEQQLEATRRRIEYLDREIDYMLINGYPADLMIYELRNLERQIRPMEKQIELLEQEKQELRKEARKKGIPPGYLRP